MNKQPENTKLTVSIPIKDDNLFRRQAFFGKISLSELFIEYQKAYLEKLEHEKHFRKAQKENNICSKCGQPILMFT